MTSKKISNSACLFGLVASVAIALVFIRVEPAVSDVYVGVDLGLLKLI